MNSIAENLFFEWFKTSIFIDLQTSIHSTELYQHYAAYAKEHQTLPFRKKTFIKYCRLKLENALKESQVEIYYANGVKFRGIRLEKKQDFEEKKIVKN